MINIIVIISCGFFLISCNTISYSLSNLDLSNNIDNIDTISEDVISSFSIIKLKFQLIKVNIRIHLFEKQIHLLLLILNYHLYN